MLRLADCQNRATAESREGGNCPKLAVERYYVVQWPRLKLLRPEHSISFQAFAE